MDAVEPQRVVVTAGGQGIGRAIIDEFLSNGATIWTCDIAPNLIEEMDRISGLTPVLADVSSETDVERFMSEAIDDMGGVDLVVNNAGIAGPGGYLEDLDLSGWKATLAVNLDGMFLVCRQAIPSMKAQLSGSIVNISSTAGLMGFPYRSPYATAKWGVIGLTKTLAMELGEFGIRVNAICPGSINNQRMDHVIEMEAKASGRSADDVRAGFMNQVSMRTFIDPSEVAAAVAFLASPAGSKISGQAISIDGNTETLRTGPG